MSLSAQQQQNLIEAIALLNQVLQPDSKTSKVPKPTYPPMPVFEQRISHFTELSKKLDPQIGILTTTVVKYLDLMKLVMGYSAICKKPDEATTAKLQNLFKEQFKPIYDLQIKEPWKNHTKAIKQLINGAFWVFTNAPEIVLKSAIEAADFNANKFKRDKKLQINEWYNTLIQAYKNLIEYTVQFFPSGLNYNFNGTGTWDQLFNNSNSGKQSEKQQPTQQKVVQVKKEVPPQVVKKNPVKQNKGGNWYIQNFQNSTIEFAEGEVQMRNSFFIQNCKGCVIKLNKSKFKSLMLSKCEKVGLFTGTLLSGIEIMNSKNVEIRIVNSCPSISVDKSDSIHIILNKQNKNTDIVSSKVTELNLTYDLNEEDLQKDHAVPDQIITRWNDKTNKFESKIYDKFI